MVSIRIFSMIVGTLLCREWMWNGASGEIAKSAWAIIAYGVAFGVLSKCAAMYVAFPRSYCRWDDRLLDPLERLAFYRRLIELAWVIMLPVGLTVTNWGPALKAAESTGMAQSVCLILWFLPTLTLLIALEWNSADLEVFIDERLSMAESAMGISPNSSTRPRLVERWLLRLKLGEFGGCLLCMTPVFAVVAVTDIAALIVPNLSVEIRACIALSVMIVTGVVTAPWWMGLWMGARRIAPSATSDRIGQLCRLAGCSGLQIRCIASKNSWCGAAVVGWHSFHRQLWIGDGLIAKLSPMELDMVVLHEIAHVKRLHFFWRLLPIVLGSFVGWAVHEIITLGIAIMPSEHALAMGLAKAGTAIGLAIGLMTTIVGIGWYARRCELDADRYACHLAALVCPWSSRQPSRAAMVMMSALENLIGSNDEAAQMSWLHPSLDDRAENLYNLVRCHPATQTLGLASPQPSD